MEFNATFLVSAVSFIIFTLIMNKLLYQPISDIVAKRQAYLDANSAEAKNNLDTANIIKQEKEQKVLASRGEVKKMIAEEAANSKEQKTQKEKEKKLEIADKIAAQKAELENEKMQAAQEIGGNINEISDSIISKLTGGEI